MHVYTDRQKDKKRQTDRKTNRDRQTERQKETDRQRQTHVYTDRKTNRDRQRQTDRKTNRDKYTDRERHLLHVFVLSFDWFSGLYMSILIIGYSDYFVIAWSSHAQLKTALCVHTVF